jgi:hypothetical protein
LRLRPGRANILNLLRKLLRGADRQPRETHAVLKPRNAIWNLGRPVASGSRNCRAQANDCSEQGKDERERREGFGNAKLFQDPKNWLEQELEREGEDHRQDDFARDRARRQ